MHMWMVVHAKVMDKSVEISGKRLYMHTCIQLYKCNEIIKHKIIERMEIYTRFSHKYNIIKLQVYKQKYDTCVLTKGCLKSKNLLHTSNFLTSYHNLVHMPLPSRTMKPPG